MRGQDVDRAELLDDPRMIERHAVSRPRAPIVTGDHELLEAELVHDVDLVLRHAPERVVAVIGQAAGLAAVAVAAQVGRDNGEIVREARGHEAPVVVRERIAVQEQDRRTRAADHATDRHLGIARLDIEAAEALVHRALLACARVYPASRDP